MFADNPKEFNQLIFESTLITENSQSCIDHIFTNISTSCSSGSLVVEIADHLPVFTILFLIILNLETFGVLKMKIFK